MDQQQKIFTTKRKDVIDSFDVDSLKSFLKSRDFNGEHEVGQPGLELLAQSLNYQLRYLAHECAIYMVQRRKRKLGCDDLEHVLRQFQFCKSKELKSENTPLKKCDDSSYCLEEAGKRNSILDCSTAVEIEICYANRPKKDIIPADDVSLLKYQVALQEIMHLPSQDFEASIRNLHHLSRDSQPVFLDQMLKLLLEPSLTHFDQDADMTDDEGYRRLLLCLLCTLNCHSVNYNKVYQVLLDRFNCVEVLTKLAVDKEAISSQVACSILLHLISNPFYKMAEVVRRCVTRHCTSILNDFANQNFDKYDHVLAMLQTFVDYLDVYQMLDAFLAHFGENSWAFLDETFVVSDSSLQDDSNMDTSFLSSQSSSQYCNYILNWRIFLNELLRKNVHTLSKDFKPGLFKLLSFAFGENFSLYTFHQTTAAVCVNVDRPLCHNLLKNRTTVVRNDAHAKTTKPHCQTSNFGPAKTTTLSDWFDQTEKLNFAGRKNSIVLKIGFPCHSTQLPNHFLPREMVRTEFAYIFHKVNRPVWKKITRSRNVSGLDLCFCCVLL